MALVDAAGAAIGKHHRMHEFVNFDENFVLELTAVLVLMAICAIVAVDRWVWAGRSDVPYRGLDGDGIAPPGDKT